MQRVHPDEQVFTVAGRIGGQGDAKGAYVIAHSPEELIDQFRDWGFEVTSVASLADVRRSLEILEAIATQSTEVGPEEFLDLLPAAPGERRPPSTIFTFVGQYAKTSEASGLLAGFGTAISGSELSGYLRSLGFDVLSVMSHSEALELQAEMDLVACDAYSDDTHLVNLKEV
ncbi:hypothetical protein LN521_00380 [Xanthomonas euvesicatoria pv. euvesicatoria]|uniref:hypothetical protein n=1 Tax=Xanthomonas euvesicatoria TaxID=456327 RepID=UPI00080D989C|nr:hypothetical protein [Xanthomonas euvesicatoria]MCC8799159.1 hypothetical protein [Xanthomonas euvesicatoria pv. euvesicatoria]MCC8807764.1 hypothetical protein [Xanthomonas euvesicatoria pv. euvesicatoria]OCG92869.1 hypothetical protein XEULMG905_00130 [Xanthomonas euvesicatoria]